MQKLIILFLVAMVSGCQAGQIIAGACGEIEYGFSLQVLTIPISGDLHGKRSPGEGVCPETVEPDPE